MQYDSELVAQMRAGLQQQKKAAQYNKDPKAWANDRLGVHLWSTQQEIIESVRDNKRTTVASCHGSGKALSIDTYIQTPDGRRTMHDLQVGDLVYDEQCRPTKIVAVTPEHDKLSTENYFLHTGTPDSASSGCIARNTAVLTSSMEHQWAVLTPQEQAKIRVVCARRGISEPDWSLWMHRTVVMTTSQLRPMLNKQLPNEPYYIVPCSREISTALSIGYRNPSASGHNQHKQNVTQGNPTGDILKQPEDWPVTIAFLTRVMEDYGTVDARGRLCLRMNTAITSNRKPSVVERAIKDIRGYAYPEVLVEAESILNAMKLKPSLTRRKHGVRYIFELAINADPTSLMGMMTASGKHDDNMVNADVEAIVIQASEYHTAQSHHRKYMPHGGWRMTGQSHARMERVKCIEVDSDRHLYLAGKDHIPTHNSMIASVAATWWIDSHPPGSAIVVSTAPTYAQVHAILWEEIRKHHNRAKGNGNPLPGSVTMADNWNLPDGTLAGYGRKPKDGDQHAFQGIHRRFVLVILDEACGVPSELWTGAEAITTNEGCRILVIGNPDDRDTDFGKSFEDPAVEHLWKRIRIPANITPNLTGEPVPALLNEVLVSKTWCDDALARWGADDPRYISKVLAMFPAVNEASLFSPAVIASGFEHNGTKLVDPPDVLYFGVDCARYGSDLNALTVYDGNDVRIIDSWGSLDTVSTAMRALRLIEDEINTYKAKWKDMQFRIRADIRVDSVGLGAGVVDTMSAKREEMRQHFEREAIDEEPWFVVREMSGSAAPPKDVGGSIQGYGNARAYWYDQAKHLMRANAINIEEHPTLKDELAGVRYKYKNGKLYIESKEEMRERGVKSPDFADSFVYAVAPVHEGLATGATVSAQAQDVAGEISDEDLAMMRESQIAPY